MKTIKEQITQEVIKGYEAEDGRRFNNPEDCSKYEESLNITLLNEIKPYILAKSNQYQLWDDLCEDMELWIISIPTEDIRMKVNVYLNLLRGKYSKEHFPNIIKPEWVGKTVMVHWNYDMDNCWSYGTVDDLCNEIKKNYEKIINPPTEAK